MKQIRELKRELFAAAGVPKPDHRFRHWAKRVTKVDTHLSNGYAFEGDFIPDGTVEVPVEPAVYLVATVAGSRQYHTTTYHVLTMDAEGVLRATQIMTTDAKPGWALRIRDQVAALLAEVSGQQADPLADHSDEELIAALERRGYQVVRKTDSC